MRNLYIVALALALAACNGGGSSNTSSAPPPIPTGSVSGITFDGLINGATVSVYDYSNGSKGDLLATAKSDNSGLYSMELQIESRPLLVELTKGVYVEEADSKQVTLGAQKMYALVNYVTGSPLQVAITPLTHLAAALANYNISKKSVPVEKAINDANKRVSDIFTFDITATIPKQITDVANATVALSPEIKYGFISGAISMWTKENAPNAGTVHVSPFASIDFIQTMYEDVFADGLLDGVGLDSANQPIQLGFGSVSLSADVYRYQLATKLITMAKDTNNKTGIADTGILSFAQTYGSNADAVFAGVATKQVSLPMPPVVIATGSVSGKAFDGLISNGAINIYDYTGGSKGGVLGTATTDTKGLYSISLQVTSRPVLIEVTGGYYTEEATGLNVQLKTNPLQKLTALVNYTEGTPIQTAVTTFSHMAAGLAQYQISKGTAVNTAINDANDRFSYITGVSVLNTIPLQITDANNVSVALTPELKYGFLAGAISMWVKNNAPSYKSIDFAQLAFNDISADGLLDGIGLDSLAKPIQLGLGSTPVNTETYRYWMGVSLLQMANDQNNKTNILPSGVKGYADQYMAVTDPLFNGVTPRALAAPIVNITSPVPGTITYPSGTFYWYNISLTLPANKSFRKTFNLNATTNDDIGIDYAELLINGVSVATIINQGSAKAPVFTIDTTKYSNALYDVAVRVTNLAGLKSTHTLSLYFDNTSPTFTQTFAAAWTSDGAWLVNGNLSDLASVGGTVSVVADGKLAPITNEGTVGFYVPQARIVALQPFEVRITDLAGNCSDYTFTPSFPGGVLKLTSALKTANVCP